MDFLINSSHDNHANQEKVGKTFPAEKTIHSEKKNTK